MYHVYGHLKRNDIPGANNVHYISHNFVVNSLLFGVNFYEKRYTCTESESI